MSFWRKDDTYCSKKDVLSRFDRIIEAHCKSKMEFERVREINRKVNDHKNTVEIEKNFKGNNFKLNGNEKMKLVDYYSSSETESEKSFQNEKNKTITIGPNNVKSCNIYDRNNSISSQSPKLNSSSINSELEYGISLEEINFSKNKNIQKNKKLISKPPRKKDAELCINEEKLALVKHLRKQQQDHEVEVYMKMKSLLEERKSLKEGDKQNQVGIQEKNLGLNLKEK